MSGRRWALSGGIGSGKSEVRRMLGSRGVDTLDADSIGHEIIEPGGPAFDAVAEAWPSTVRDGRIERGRLAAIVFAQREQLERLEGITHPLIIGTIRSRVERFDGPAVVEIPLAPGRLGEGWGTIVVDADDEMRFERAVARGMAAEDVRARMEAQPTRPEWLAGADLVVPNHGGLEQLDEVVERLTPLL